MVKNLGIHHQATMWNPFSSGNSSATNTTGNSPNVQVPHVSQTPISPEGAQQLNNTMNQIDGQLVNNVPVEKARTIKEFIDESPHALYIIDGQKGEQQSIICRGRENGGKTCLKLQYEAVQLFKQMQKFEYFCSLPNNMEATYFECRKIK